MSRNQADLSGVKARVAERISTYAVNDGGFVAFREEIRRYFRNHGRQFSWRDDINPYRILVSEIMLQQTQTGRVEEKFAAFISRFRSFEELAAAEFSEVLRLWKGLGYNRRAKYLHDAARTIVHDFDGVLPEDPAALVRLPGIGPATAASICVFAFNKPYPFVETNIRTVFIHFFFTDQKQVSDRQILSLVEQTMDEQAPRDWFYGLMDYGVMLKKAIGNLSRRSSHYQKQSRFEGSNRQLRGRILAILLDQERTSADTLAALIDQPVERVMALIDALRAEGLIQKKGRYLSLS
jgi:A/G-specific adenine glycosylase